MSMQDIMGCFILYKYNKINHPRLGFLISESITYFLNETKTYLFSMLQSTVSRHEDYVAQCTRDSMFFLTIIV